MPNDNLGVAHGTIRVTYDGRGAKQAQASYAKLSSQMESMQRSMLRMEKAINSSEKSLKSADVEIKKVSRSTSRFGGDVFATRRKIHAFNNDIRGMASDLKLLYGVMGTSIKYMGRFNTAIKVLNKAGSYGANQQLQIFRSLSIAIADMGAKHNTVLAGMANAQKMFTRNILQNEQALEGIRSVITLSGGGYQLLRNKILGVNNAMQSAPKWVQSMQKVNNVLMWTARAGIGLAALLGPLRMMDRLINNRISAKGLVGIGRGFTMLSGRMAAFGRITERIFGRDYFTPFANRLAGVEGNLGKFMDRTSVRSRAFSVNMNRASKSLGEFAMKSKGLLGGIVLISAGMSNLWKRMQWFFKLPKPLMAALAVTFSKVLPGAMKAFGDALKGVSNLIVGLWDGIKQLSGGLTVLPGLIASVGAAISGLVPLFHGLKDAFKNIFSDDFEEAWEAYAKLPEHLRPIANALLDQKRRWKDMQVTLQKVGFKGLQDDIRSISDSYFPIFEKGSRQVIIATRAMKDEFVNFLLQGQTKTNTSAIYSSTAGAIMNLAKATQPAAAGLLEMSKVGSEFLRSMSSFAPVLANMFNTWSQANSQNGQMEKWMQDSVSGAYDLIRGLKSLTEAAFGVLTIFKQNNGDNFLERFAESMERLNARVRESQITGKLAKIRDYVQDMGEGKMEEMVDLFRAFGDAIDKVIPFLKTLTDAFSGTFIPLLENALWVISHFLQVLNDLGITNIVGTILGWVGAFKLLPKWIAATMDGIKILAGTIAVLVNKGKVISMLSTAFTGLGLAMTRFGSIGNKVGTGLANVTAAGSKTMGVISSLFTAFSAAAAGAMAFYAIYSTGSANSREFNKQLKQNETSLLDFRDALQSAFVEDRAIAGKNVMNAVSAGLDQMMQDIEATSAKAPGMMDHIYDYFFRMDKRAEGVPDEIPIIKQLAALFDESDVINKEQEAAASAEAAANGLKKIRESGIDLTAVLMSSDTEFNKFIETQRAAGVEGNAAADALVKQRNVLKQTEEAVKRAGPGALALADGIRQIAEAGGDATAKLDGLKKILEALGLIKVDAIQAAADYEQGIADLTNRVTDLINEGNALSQSDLMTGGSFNVATQQGRDFFNVMRQLGESFLASVAAGNDADAAYKTFLDSLTAISQQTGISIEDLKSLGAQVGVLPEFAKIAVQLEGKDQSTQDLANAFFQMQSMVANGVNVPISIRPGDAEKLDKSLESILGRDMTDVDNGNLVIKPGLSQVDVNKVLNKLGQMGIQIGDNNPVGPQAQAQMPVEVKPQQVTPGEVAGAASGVTPAQPGSGQSAAQTQESLILGPLADAAAQANTQGSAFVDALAKGIEENPAAKDAAERLAQELKDRFHQSPPKKGPLSEHGDAARYAGQAFAQSYSGGLTSGTGNVASAAEGIAGAASGSLRGDKNYEAGKFLGQISQLVDFASNFVDAVGKLTDTFLSAAKFMSDPLGKGTFFGKRPRWVRDPNISDQALARTRADNAQQRVLSMFGNGQRPDLYDPATGRIRGNAPGNLGPAAGKQDIANYILQKAMSLGYSRQQANQFLIQAVGESGLSGTANGGDQGSGAVQGIFQFDPSTWKQAGGGNITNPQENIDNYFNLAAQRGLTPENFTAGSQLGTQVSIGGPWHPENAAKGHLDGAQAAAQQYINSYVEGAGQFVDGIMPGMPAAPGNLTTTKLQTGPGLVANAAQVAAILEANFPGITQIGGQDNRPPGTPQMHTQGRALDVGIGDNLALGDKINEFLMANAEQLGIQSTIWRDIGRNLVANEGGGPGTTYTAGGHMDHVHVQFADGSKMDVAADGTATMQVPANSPYAGLNYGLPKPPEDNKPSAPKDLVVRNPDGSFTAVHTGSGDQPGDIEINPMTGRPWTPEESAEFWNRPENALQYDRSGLQAGDLDTPGIFQGTQEQMLDELKNQTPLLQKALTVAQDENASMTDTATALEILSAERDRQTEMDTPQSRAMAGQLDSIIGNAASNQGLTEEQNPFDQAAEIAGAATSIAGDIFNIINSVIDTIGSTKNLTTSLVRGWSNTEDIFAAIDDIQSFIQLGADIAGSVSSITGLAAGFVGAGAAGDPSGGASGAAAALGAVSQIAGLVQAGFETANAIIDLGQEAYRIIGSYVGDFLSSLTGGIAGGLQGQVKFLLDEQTNQLLAYSADNPLDKRAHTLPGQTANPNARDQLIGNINVYGGPGVDPRDQTRQMMFQVRSSQLMAATGQ